MGYNLPPGCTQADIDRHFGGDEPDGPDDQPTELDLVYRDLHERNEELEVARARITRLEAENKRMISALWQIEDYLDGKVDVVDGSYGEPAPNAEMSLMTEVREALGNNIRF